MMKLLCLNFNIQYHFISNILKLLQHLRTSAQLVLKVSIAFRKDKAALNFCTPRAVAADKASLSASRRGPAGSLRRLSCTDRMYSSPHSSLRFALQSDVPCDTVLKLSTFLRKRLLKNILTTIYACHPC